MSIFFPEESATEFATDLNEAYRQAGGQFNNGNPIVIYGNPALSGAGGYGILTQRTPTSTYNGGITGNRRDQSSMAMAPRLATDPRIGLNEMMIRMGSANLGVADQGPTAQMAAMGNTFADVQELNRRNALALYKEQMDLLGKGKTKAKKGPDNTEQINQIDTTLYKMDEALQFLNEGGVTGFFDYYIAGAFDKLAGNKDAVNRRLLSELRVDDALLRIAQTKGAISNHEMNLFLSPVPDLDSQETEWIDWIRRRQSVLKLIRSRLDNNQQVDDPATKDQINQFGQLGSGGFTPTPEDQAILDKY